MDVREKRPEMRAGNFSRDDTTVAFYLRINALISAQSKVLDLGAGRGAGLETSDSFPRSLMRLKGRVAWLSGCDVDEAVLQNEYLDDRRILDPNGPLPYEDATFDLVYSDWVIEHIADVDSFVSEVGRVLKPGGWFCARTPNKWGYIGLGARAVPDALEGAFLRRLQPGRQQRDVFPKMYRLNTLPAIRRAFGPDRWVDCSYSCSAPPAYSGGNPVLFSLIELFQSATPSALNTVLMVFTQKR